VTLSGTDLIEIVAIVIAAFGVSYVLLLSRLKAMLTERQLKIADQLGALDDAIRALETRLAEHQLRVSGLDLSNAAASADIAALSVEHGNEDSEESGEIAPEIQAAIAAATVAALGPNAVVQSVKPVLSAWSQQGRVMVQGGHNLRMPR